MNTKKSKRTNMDTQGRIKKALDIFENGLGKEHLETATIYNNLAGIYNSQGDYP